MLHLKSNGLPIVSRLRLWVALNPHLLLLPLLLPFLLKCSSPVFHQHELAEELLRPRPAHDGHLTNRACTKYKGDQCQDWSLKEYDLADPKIRRELNDFGFICKLAGKRYKVCLDVPGFCRTEDKCSWIDHVFGCKPTVTEVLDMPYQLLIDAGLICFSERFYDWTEVE